MYWIYLYGSYATARNDHHSDLDLLVVTDDQSTVAELIDHASRLALTNFHSEPSISAYHRTRIDDLYSRGSLFAWHLYDESKLLQSSTDFDILHATPPAEYTYTTQDFRLFSWLVASISTRNQYLSSNKWLEAGYLYTAMRNIGVIASARRGHPYDYSSTAIFRCRPAVPVSYQAYQLYRSIKCNRQNAEVAPDINTEHFKIDVTAMKSWIRRLPEVTYV